MGRSVSFLRLSLLLLAVLLHAARRTGRLLSASGSSTATKPHPVNAMLDNEIPSPSKGVGVDVFTVGGVHADTWGSPRAVDASESERGH